MATILDLCPELWGIILSFLPLIDRMSFALTCRVICFNYYGVVLNAVRQKYCHNGLRKLVELGDLDGIRYMHILNPSTIDKMFSFILDTPSLNVFNYIITHTNSSILDLMLHETIVKNRPYSISLFENGAKVPFEDSAYMLKMIITHNRFDLAKYVIPFSVYKSLFIYENICRILIHCIQNKLNDFVDYIINILDESSFELNDIKHICCDTSAIISPEIVVKLFTKINIHKFESIIIHSFIVMDRVDLLELDFEKTFDIIHFNSALQYNAVKCVKYIAQFINYEQFSLTTMQYLQTTDTAIRDFVKERYILLCLS
jgi:hypothetical protein